MANSIQELLEEIRSKKGLLLGRRSAAALYTFLAGFAFARKDIPGSEDYALLADFNEWVQKRYNTKSTQGWAKIIEFYCNDEAEELPLFWQLYDQYLEKVKRNGRRSKSLKEPVSVASFESKTTRAS